MYYFIPHPFCPMLFSSRPGDTCSKPSRGFFLNQQTACRRQPTRRQSIWRPASANHRDAHTWPCVFPRSARWRSTSSQDKNRISSLQDRSDATFLIQALTARLLVACSTAEWVM
ncbi:hypothetical protein GGI35DRAFT_445495 [Trichoderma velutinum]